MVFLLILFSDWGAFQQSTSLLASSLSRLKVLAR